MVADIRITGAEQMKALGRDLKAASPALRRGLNKEIRDAVKPIVADMKREILAMESTATSGGGSAQRRGTYVDRAKDHEKAKERAAKRAFGLRDSIARSLAVRVSFNGSKTGVTIYSKSEQLGAGGKGLPGDTDKGSWRHPVFGNKDNFVTQTGKKGWFTATGYRHVEDVRKAVLAAINDVARQLTK